MKTISRRSILSALGAALPFGIGAALQAAPPGHVAVGEAPEVRLRSFEEAVRAAFAERGRGSACRRSRWAIPTSSGPACRAATTTERSPASRPAR